MKDTPCHLGTDTARLVTLDQGTLQPKIISSARVTRKCGLLSGAKKWLTLCI